jgi:hypothetical protein
MYQSMLHVQGIALTNSCSFLLVPEACSVTVHWAYGFECQ